MIEIEADISPIMRAYRESILYVAPPPEIKISDWADEYRMLSQGSSAEPGRWNTDRAPYQRGIYEAVTEEGIEEIILMTSAQVGKSELLLNIIGYHIHYDAAPIMLVQPTGDMAEAFSKDRLSPMISDTRVLKDKVSKSKSRDSNNTILHKKFKGGHVTMIGANAPSKLASRPIRILLMDEIDRYPFSSGSEGDPVSLAKKRTTTFIWDKKIVLVSTPTIKGKSPIEYWFNKSDKRRYHVPCPQCETRQILEFKYLKWSKSRSGKVSNIFYKCLNDCRILEKDKMKMLKLGKWIAEGEKSSRAGFHLNELYSPWSSWSSIIENFLEAKDDPDVLKAWMNTTLGESWEERGDAPDWRRLYERRENYNLGFIPNDKLVMLTCGVDVQRDRIECHVWGWSFDKQSYLVDLHVIYGDTSLDSGGPWKELSEFIDTSYDQEGSTTKMHINMTAVDSGFNTQNVYNFCRQFSPNRVIPIKGQDKMRNFIGSPKIVDLNIKGKQIRRGARYWPIGVSTIKSQLYSWLKILKPKDDEDFSPGYVHFPQIDEEFFKQVTAEELMVKKNTRGYTVFEWIKIRERNEALDCFCYARAAASIIGLDRYDEQQLHDLKLKNAPINSRKGTVRKSSPSRKTPSFWS